jgi:hypothetical protein
MARLGFESAGARAGARTRHAGQLRNACVAATMEGGHLKPALVCVGCLRKRIRDARGMFAAPHARARRRHASPGGGVAAERQLSQLSVCVCVTAGACPGFASARGPVLAMWRSARGCGAQFHPSAVNKPEDSWQQTPHKGASVCPGTRHSQEPVLCAPGQGSRHLAPGRCDQAPPRWAAGGRAGHRVRPHLTSGAPRSLSTQVGSCENLSPKNRPRTCDRFRTRGGGARFERRVDSEQQRGRVKDFRLPYTSSGEPVVSQSAAAGIPDWLQ